MSMAHELGCGNRAAGFHWCPPLALMEAFNTVTDFKKLCGERLAGDILRIIEEQELFKNIEKSRYDYRKFLLAKQ